MQRKSKLLLSSTVVILVGTICGTIEYIMHNDGPLESQPSIPKETSPLTLPRKISDVVEPFPHEVNQETPIGHLGQKNQADSGVPSDELDPLTAELAQVRGHTRDWGDALIHHFPQIPAVTALVATHQEFMDEIIARNEHLCQQGVPMEARREQLGQFTVDILPTIVERTGSATLAMKLLRENTRLKLEIDHYLDENTVPLPRFLYDVHP